MIESGHRSHYNYLILAGIFLLAPTLLFAQKELKRYDRARYADVGYTKLGFGEVNRQLLTQKQARKLNRRIRRIQTDYGAIIIFVSFIAEEVRDWENGKWAGLPGYYLGEDPRAKRNHVIMFFSEEDGRNWIRYGSDNASDFAAHTTKLDQLFASKYRKPNAYRLIRSLLKQIDRIYARLDNGRKNALFHPQLSAKEWTDLAWAEMDIAGDYGSAITHLKNALKLDAANARANLLLGYAYMELQDWDSAEEAFTASWSLKAGFDTALGMLTLHHLRNNLPEVGKWADRVRRFSTDFQEKVYETAHYSGGGFFLGKTTRKVFKQLFQREIRESNMEKTPEADALIDEMNDN